MPTRILRDWTDSFAVDELDAHAERFFVRLIMKADDYGRFHADPRMLRSMCFPLRSDVRDTDITRWLAACEKAGLLRCYDDDRGRALLEIQNFGQRQRTESKFPSPGDCPTNDRKPPTNDGLVGGGGGGVCGDEREGESPLPPEGELVTEDLDEFAQIARLIPAGASRKSKTDQRRIRINGLTDLMRRLNGFFGRRDERWTVYDAKAILDVRPTPEELDLMEERYLAIIPDKDWRRQDLSTLLNNWRSELDRARSWKANQAA